MIKIFLFIKTSIKCLGDTFFYFRDEKGVFLSQNQRVTGMLAILTLSYEIALRKSIICLGGYHGDFFFLVVLKIAVEKYVRS